MLRVWSSPLRRLFKRGSSMVFSCHATKDKSTHGPKHPTNMTRLWHATRKYIGFFDRCACLTCTISAKEQWCWVRTTVDCCWVRATINSCSALLTWFQTILRSGPNCLVIDSERMHRVANLCTPTLVNPLLDEREKSTSAVFPTEYGHP